MSSSQEQYGQVANYNTIPKSRGDGQSSALEVDLHGNLLSSLHDLNNNPVSPNPLNLLPYDYVTMTEAPAGTETYTFKTGGSGGTTTNTVVIVYTDSTKATLSTVTKT